MPPVAIEPSPAAVAPPQAGALTPRLHGSQHGLSGNRQGFGESGCGGRAGDGTPGEVGGASSRRPVPHRQAVGQTADARDGPLSMLDTVSSDGIVAEGGLVIGGDRFRAYLQQTWASWLLPKRPVPAPRDALRCPHPSHFLLQPRAGSQVLASPSANAATRRSRDSQLRGAGGEQSEVRRVQGRPAMLETCLAAAEAFHSSGSSDLPHAAAAPAPAAPQPSEAADALTNSVADVGGGLWFGMASEAVAGPSGAGAEVARGVRGVAHSTAEGGSAHGRGGGADAGTVSGGAAAVKPELPCFQGQRAECSPMPDAEALADNAEVLDQRANIAVPSDGVPLLAASSAPSGAAAATSAAPAASSGAPADIAFAHAMQDSSDREEWQSVCARLLSPSAATPGPVQASGLPDVPSRTTLLLPVRVGVTPTPPTPAGSSGAAATMVNRGDELSPNALRASCERPAAAAAERRSPDVVLWVGEAAAAGRVEAGQDGAGQGTVRESDLSGAELAVRAGDALYLSPASSSVCARVWHARASAPDAAGSAGDLPPLHPDSSSALEGMVQAGRQAIEQASEPQPAWLSESDMSAHDLAGPAGDRPCPLSSTAFADVFPGSQDEGNVASIEDGNGNNVGTSVDNIPGEEDWHATDAFGHGGDDEDGDYDDDTDDDDVNDDDGDNDDSARVELCSYLYGQVRSERESVCVLHCEHAPTLACSTVGVHEAVRQHRT
jgi:hypothetical protein